MGKLIVFEGIDGSGKSTQFQMMRDRLTAEKKEFMSIQFPRYDKSSSALIKMYLGGEFGKDPGCVNAYAASSFYAVDRYASYVQDWREHYENNGLILTDRYTTSNALHQGSKMGQDERKQYFDWLYEYEFALIGLPKPDLVLYMDIDAEIAAQRLSARQVNTGTHADIHEQNLAYLDGCAKSGVQAAAHYRWRTINVVQGSIERSVEDIHEEAYALVSGCL